jgi:NADH:ubiquinone oxidoreductase subunit 6 (subunit J)
VTKLQYRRIVFLVAAIATLIALVLMVLPQSHQADHDAWAAILPLLFVGLISPLALLGLVAFFNESRTPDAPILAASFQRPPPFLIA